jgi:predicted permease
VERAAWVSNAFFSYNPDTTIIVEHRPSSAQSNEQVMDDVASPAYFQTLGTALYRGRFFGDQDTVRSTPVAIVNNTMARRFWPNADPIGERFRTYPDEPWRTVVGVVADMRRSGLEREPISQFFLPAAQAPSRGMDLVVRTRQVSTGLANTIRSEIRAVDASVPVFRVSTLEQQMNEFMGLRRFQTLLIALFAAAALVLSAIGVFGLMHYSALQRKREIGLRLALGAQSWEVLSMMMAQGLRLVLAGSGIGILGGIWLVRLISALLYNVGPADPVSWLSAGGILLVAGAAASYLPARRAAAADPLASLHENG